MSDATDDWRRRFERLQRLYQVSQVLHSTLEPQHALQLIVEQAVQLTSASSGSLVLLNPHTGFLEIEAACGLPPEARQLKLRAGEGITGWVVRTGQPALVGDVRQDPRYIMARPEVRSELAVPLRLGEEVRGLLNVDSEKLHAFTAEDQSLLEELSAQAALVIQQTWQYEQHRLKARLFESLVAVSQLINSTLNLDETLAAITQQAHQLMQARLCSLLLLDDSGRWLDLRAAHGAGPDYINKPRLNVEESLVGSVVRRRKVLQVENVQISQRYQHVEVAAREGLVSLLSAPLTFGGRCLGVLNVYTSHPHVFSNEEIRILTALAGLSAVAIEKARLYERVVDLEEALRHAEKFSALGLLAGEVAHEIRNPLTVIKMLFHSLNLQFAPEDPRATDVRIIGEKLEQLDRTVERVLGFARSAEPQFGPVSLPQVLDELGLLVRHKLRQQNIHWQPRLEPALPAVWGDATQLGQALLNLVLNAVQAMPQGGELTLTARRLPRDAARPPSHVVIEVSDTGEGMSEDQCRRAFTPLLSTTRAKGTGLGLVLVGRIVEAHHGRIQVTSRPGKGTRFRLTLPVAPQTNG
ncbi:GAF domain-containing protein [Fontisphaera persica]|uniref:GAF domain-containing protein n=1 Tax=Fontisphaera persica TaxID=2974023 RepID=UPI0024C087B6|nr:GAF domain-containing protein [Fontisphaera persica]WCJ58457.1 GAF domain-containing protein [Fontisphaera persica]